MYRKSISAVQCLLFQSQCKMIFYMYQVTTNNYMYMYNVKLCLFDKKKEKQLNTSDITAVTFKRISDSNHPGSIP